MKESRSDVALGLLANTRVIDDGSHSIRVGIGGALFPRNNHGLNPDEITLPELLRAQGYATAIVGKWHLGNEDMFQPMNHGFDTWYGTPSSREFSRNPGLRSDGWGLSRRSCALLGPPDL